MQLHPFYTEAARVCLLASCVAAPARSGQEAGHGARLAMGSGTSFACRGAGRVAKRVYSGARSPAVLSEDFCVRQGLAGKLWNRYVDRYRRQTC